MDHFQYQNQNNQYPQQNQLFQQSDLKDVDYVTENLPPFKKDFYKLPLNPRSKEEVQNFRESNEMEIRTNIEIPDPFIEWKDIQLPKYLDSTIQQNNFINPTPIQSQALPIILKGHDLQGVAQTGSGKTLAFLLPAIIHINAQPKIKRGDGPIALILAPTRELAIQIQEQAQIFGSNSGVTSTCVYGGVSKYLQKRALTSGEVDLVIATPGRLIDFLQENITNLKRVTYLVLDEADRMLDMGFEQQLRMIMGQIRYKIQKRYPFRPDRQATMFTATMPKNVKNLAEDLFQVHPVHVQIGSQELTVNSNISQNFQTVNGEQNKYNKLLQIVNERKDQKILVFCQRKQQTEQISYFLQNKNIKSESINGNKNQQQRDYAMKQFRQGNCQILVATDVVSRGLDIKDISLVINFDLPMVIDDYVHRIGRTGRAGQKGETISFFDERDNENIVQDLVKFLRDSKNEIPEAIQKAYEFQVMQKHQQRSQYQQKQGNNSYNERRNDNQGNYSNSLYSSGSPQKHTAAKQYQQQENFELHPDRNSRYDYDN